MKAITYINRIKKENGCSIHTAEMLTKAFHREKLLGDDLAIRFRPLFGDFDIVNADFLTVGVNYSSPITLENLESLASL